MCHLMCSLSKHFEGTSFVFSKYVNVSVMTYLEGVGQTIMHKFENQLFGLESR